MYSSESSSSCPPAPSQILSLLFRSSALSFHAPGFVSDPQGHLTHCFLWKAHPIALPSPEETSSYNPFTSLWSWLPFPSKYLVCFLVALFYLITLTSEALPSFVTVVFSLQTECLSLTSRLLLNVCGLD